MVVLGYGRMGVRVRVEPARSRRSSSAIKLIDRQFIELPIEFLGCLVIAYGRQARLHLVRHDSVCQRPAKHAWTAVKRFFDHLAVFLARWLSVLGDVCDVTSSQQSLFHRFISRYERLSRGR